MKAERNRLFAASAVSIAACFEIGKKDDSKLGFDQGVGGAWVGRV